MFRLVTLVVVMAIVFVPTLWRAKRVSNVVFATTGETSNAFFEVIRNDAPLLGIILGLLVLTAALRSKWLAVVTFLGAIGVQLTLAMDLLVYRQFSQRLAWSDVIKFYDYALEYIADFDLAFLALILVGLGAFVAVACLIFYALRKQGPGPKGAALLVGVIASVSVASWVSRNVEFVHYRIYQNFLSYNKMISSEAIAYSDALMKAVRDPSTDTCATYDTVSGPVIYYMVESLSSYQSAFFGGVNDWTPRLDALARDNLALTDFYANGFTTEDGELSLLTARNALYPPNSFTTGGGSSFSGHWDPDRSLPYTFNKAGYESTFMTTSDLAFSSTGKWMQAIGFDDVRGSTDPFYEGMERFHFDAPADAALVDNILQTFDTAEAPQFIFAKTVSSHHPHIHPETKERSVEAIMRYTDEQIGRLYDGLDERGFFETGHLVIVGDHRAMLAITRGEVERVGLDKAYTQVPAVVISRTFAPEPVVMDSPYSQVDLANTMMASFDGAACHGDFQGLIWGESAAPATYILHRRGDRRHQFSVFSDGNFGVVTLGGDKTNLSGTGFTQRDQSKIVDFVNATRIKAQMAKQSR